jgi:hypothetical protein
MRSAGIVDGGGPQVGLLQRLRTRDRKSVTYKLTTR